jgi:hypothetical protein
MNLGKALVKTCHCWVDSLCSLLAGAYAAVGQRRGRLGVA